MKLHSKHFIYTVLLILGLAGVLAVQSTPHINNQRILGEEKDSACKDVFIQEEKTDPTGQKYKSNQLVTQKERDEAESIRSKLQLARSKEEAKKDVKEMLNNSDPMGYIQKVFIAGAPFAILLALGIIGSLFYWFCFFLEKFCCKRDLRKKPYTDSDLGRPATCIFVFGLTAIGTIIYGYIVASDFSDMNSKFKCAVIAVLDELITGEQIGEYTWLGLANADAPMDEMINNLDTVAQAQETRFQDTAWIRQDLDNLFNTNQQIYDYYTGMEVPESPNPAMPQNYGVISLFIRDRLGPVDQNFTTTYNIHQQLNTTTRAFAEACIATEQSSSNIKLNVDSIKDTLLQGKKNMNASNQQFRETLTTAKKEMQKLDDSNALVNSGLQVFYGAQLLGALLAFLGVSFTHCTGPRPKCRVLLHLGWFIMSLMMIIGLLISTFLMPVGVMLSETCTWMEDYLNNQEEFNDPSYTFLPADIISKISVCKFGDGLLFGEFEIDQEMGMITDMMAAIDVTLGLQEKGDGENDNYVDLSLTTKVMDAEIQQMSDIASGIQIDSDASNDDSHVVSIGNLNKWADSTLSDSYQTNPQIGNCQTGNLPQDQYVFHPSDCTYSPQYDNTGATSQNYGSKTCIVVSELSLLEQAQRYAQISLECDPKVEQNLQSYFLALYRYDMSRKAMFGSIGSDYTDLKTDTEAYHQKLVGFIDTTRQFKEDIAKFEESSDALINSFNCNFLGQSIDRVYDGLCVAYVSPTFKVIIATAIASVCMLFASFFSFCLAIRYARKVRPQKEHKQLAKKSKKNLQKDNAKGVKKEKVKPTATNKKEATRKSVKKAPVKKAAAPKKGKPVGAKK